jgi:ubiquitin-protein ligase
VATKILRDGWTVDGGYLVLRKRIVPTHVKKQDKVYALKPDHPFFVQDIKVPIQYRVTSAKCNDAYHPNVSSLGKGICLGSLEGKDLETVVTYIVQELLTINLDSAYPNDATNELRDKWDEYVEEEVEEFVWDTSSVW